MTDLSVEMRRWQKIKLRLGDSEMDDAADSTRGCVDPAVNLCLCRSGWHFIVSTDPN